jgi:hypothetical protein
MAVGTTDGFGFVVTVAFGVGLGFGLVGVGVGLAFGVFPEVMAVCGANRGASV